MLLTRRTNRPYKLKKSESMNEIKVKWEGRKTGVH